MADVPMEARFPASLGESKVSASGDAARLKERVHGVVLRDDLVQK